jgi:hypothetical protein
MRRRLSLALATSLLTAAAVLPAAAEPFIVDKRAGAQQYQTVVYNPAGNFFVFWSDVPTGALHGRRWTLRDGLPKVLGARRTYDTAANARANQPAGSFDSEAKVLLLVWQEDRPVGGVIVGVFVNRKGKPLGRPFDLSNDPECFPIKPGLDFNSKRETWMVVWSYFPTAGCPPRGIEGREVESDGTLGPIRRISSAVGDAQPNIAYHGKKKLFLVTWVNGNRSLARRLTSTGTPRGGAIQLSTDSEEPNVGYDEEREEWLVVLQELAGADRVLGRSVDHLGEVGTAFEIGKGPAAGVGAFDPGIAWSGADGSFLITFESDPGGDLDLFGQVVRDAERSGSVFTIADGPGRQEGNLTRGRHLDCSTAEKLCLVVWESNDNDDGDLYGRFVTLP